MSISGYRNINWENLYHELDKENAVLKVKIAFLEKENEDMKQLLDGANHTFDKISQLVGYKYQYRDLVEAVELKLNEKNGF